MSDYEKDDELRRKYGEVMDSIADDIRQINVNKSEKIVLDEKADDISENTGDILSGFESAGGSDAIENSDVKHDYSCLLYTSSDCQCWFSRWAVIQITSV